MKWHPLQNSCLGSPMDRGAWQTTVHVVERVGHDSATRSAPYIKCLLKPVIYWQALGSFQVLVIINSAAMNSAAFELKCSSFLDTHPGKGWLDPVVTLFSVFLSNLHTVFHNVCTNLYSQQLCMCVWGGGEPGSFEVYQIQNLNWLW